MYSIQTWIYGSPLNEAAVKALSKHLKIYLTEEVAPYPITPTLEFHTKYSGSAESTPSYIGFELAETDECSDYIKLDLAKQTITVKPSVKSLTPTPAQIATLTSWYNSLPVKLQAVIPAPGNYIVFSTS